MCDLYTWLESRRSLRAMAGLLDAAVLAEYFAMQRLNRMFYCTPFEATTAQKTLLES